MFWPFRRRRRKIAAPPRAATERGRAIVVILDGTMSTLEEGYETNAGLIYRLLQEAQDGERTYLLYEAGIQWKGWRRALDVIAGIGINSQIRRAYGFIAARYRPGDRIYLVGYSRGAYAVRSLAGMIELLGLLRREAATERNVRRMFDFYQGDTFGREARIFAAARCLRDIEVEVIGCFDTVKALGIRWPVLWRLAPAPTEFHSDQVGKHTRHAFHALARHETRMAYAPVLWRTTPDTTAEVRQVWFRGSHGDVGGHLGDFVAARPLANIPLVWMCERLEDCGLQFPDGWRKRFPTDPNAPAVGTLRGYAKLFVWRRRRRIGVDASEVLWEDLPKVAAPGQQAERQTG